MAYTNLTIANKAGGRIGGFGDQLNGDAFLPNLTGTDKVTNWVNLLFPQVRQHVICDLAKAKSPFRETVKYADLGDSLDIADCPEIGEYEYAFDLPDDYLCMVRLLDEDFSLKREYQFETIINKDGDGWILLTDYLTNADGTSAFIEYCIDQDNPALFSDAFVECFATLLAAELCPVLGRDIKTRQQMLLEYEQLSKPNAKSYNQSQLNNEAHYVPDYLGGRVMNTRRDY